jgi:Ca2+/H+ antiporter, TMEM165/GDT1 family
MPAGVGRDHVSSCSADPRTFQVETVLTSIGIVALAEIGDKTQLLAVVLAARLRKPIPIILGILAATLLNHAAAAGIGYLVAAWLAGPAFQIAVGAGFVVMAAWSLVPDTQDEGAADRSAHGVFLTTLVAFFLVEIGDKTQIATVGLAARFEQFYPVVLGTTLGMMLANIPAVLIGDRLAERLPVKPIRIVAAIVFAALGLLTIAGLGG